MKFLNVLSLLAVGSLSVNAHGDHASPDTSPANSDVVVLTDATYADFIKNVELISLVEYYAPWCGHCKSLAPEYEVAATALKKENIILAKVDCTVEKDTCEKEEIKGFPTLKIWRKGSSVPGEYNGPRVAAGIISYMSKQSKPALTELTPATTDAFSSSDLVVIIGTFTDQSNADFKAFEATANALSDSYSFGWNVGTETKIVLYKKFDDGKADFTEKVTEESLKKFIETESIPLVGEIGPDNYPQYVNRDIPIAYFFYETAAHKETTGKTIIEPLAKIFKGKVSTVYIDAVKFGSHGQSMNLPTTWPGFVISYPKQNTKFPFVGELTLEALKAHTQAVVDGTAKPSLKSAEIPASNNEPVKIVVNKNYDQIVKDSKKDVFIEIYAPWCGHCKKLSPIWDTLASQLESESNIVIAKMDNTENDMPLDAGFSVEGYPTLKLYKANSNEIVDYSGDRSLPDLVKFLKENAVYGYTIKEHVGIEDTTAFKDESHDEL